MIKSPLTNTYTFDLFRTTLSVDRGSSVETLERIARGLRGHFSFYHGKGMVRSSGLALHSYDITGKLMYFAENPEPLQGDYVEIWRGNQYVGKFMITNPGKNELASGKFDSWILSLKQIKNV